MALPPIKNTGELSIGGVSLHGPGFSPLDLMMLWFPGGTKGDNLNLPRYQGTLAQEIMLDEHHVSVPMGFIGDTRYDGDPPDISVYETLEVNIAYFEATFIIPTYGTAGVQADLVMPSGETRTGLINQIVLTIDSRTQDMCAGSLSFAIPNGRLGL
jgi:hypothetical protein